MSTDAIVVLKADHQEIRKQFKRFTEAGQNATAAKGKIVDKIIELLTVHTYIENEVMYPEVRSLLPDLEDDVLESYEEHHVADVLVAELAEMTGCGKVRRENHGADRERHAPHGRGRTGLVPQGPRRLKPQAVTGTRRENDRPEEDRTDHPGPAQRLEKGHRRRHLLTAPRPRPRSIALMARDAELRSIPVLCR